MRRSDAQHGGAPFNRCLVGEGFPKNLNGSYDNSFLLKTDSFHFHSGIWKTFPIWSWKARMVPAAWTPPPPLPPSHVPNVERWCWVGCITLLSILSCRRRSSDRLQILTSAVEGYLLSPPPSGAPGDCCTYWRLPLARRARNQTELNKFQSYFSHRKEKKWNTVLYIRDK